MSRHLICTTARAQTCPGCGATLLAALEHGIPTRVDATPINPADEVGILLTGAATYTLTRGRQLVHRTPEKIRSGWPPGTIHPAHQCPTPTLT